MGSHSTVQWGFEDSYNLLPRGSDPEPSLPQRVHSQNRSPRCRVLGQGRTGGVVTTARDEETLLPTTDTPTETGGGLTVRPVPVSSSGEVVPDTRGC